MVNNTPFAPFGLNQTLLCPADLISPWRVAGVHGPPKVQEIPDSGLQTLVEAKRIMTIKQDKMTEILWEETRTEVERYKPGNLKLGKNKSHPHPHVTIGGVVMTELGGKPPCLGVVVGTTQRDAQIRFKRGTRTVPLGQCVPIASSGNMSSGTRIGETFSHFISVEFDRQSLDFQMFTTKVKGMQDLLGDVAEIGKPVKQESLHITLAVLHMTEEEVPGLMEKTRRIWEEFVDLMGSPNNLVLSFKGLAFGDYGTIWIKMELGKEAIMILREMIESGLGENLTDLRFEPHLTVFKSSQISEDVQQGIRGSASKMNLGCATIRKISLRPRKVGKELPEPILVLPFPIADNCTNE
jgi:2'-5' RNA ligase